MDQIKDETKTEYIRLQQRIAAGVDDFGEPVIIHQEIPARVTMKPYTPDPSNNIGAASMIIYTETADPYIYAGQILLYKGKAWRIYDLTEEERRTIGRPPEHFNRGYYCEAIA